MTQTDTPAAIHLKDYAPAPYAIRHANLVVALDPTATQVTSELTVEGNSSDIPPLELDGEELGLEVIAINGKALAQTEFTYAGRKLTIHRPPAGTFTLHILQTCNPSANTALSGLYLSGGNYCTQMEAEGFRRFAFFQDRPDVMATFHVRIEAPQSIPVLLSNGNPVERGIIQGTGHHFAEWHDPHPKPSYLFALVAGDLARVEDSFTTRSGRTVSLGIYVEKGKEDRCAWAMESLKTSMRWDEEAFGREYDLDVFNIVAVSDFNMGAMENKGLNIFNDKYILARPETATDIDYERIEAIIAHEYFHNWTGNRITCRDWFQLCLKEGLTVFRDQEFTSDVRSRAVKRIQDVRTLRSRQFPEDQGALAHPVRPSSYIEINNFYTPTVYEKGAELCRMIQTLIGKAAFRKAMDLYFERHDGEAATVEDFIRCMSDASGRDLSAFFRWYEQAGTPVVTVSEKHDERTGVFELTLTQATPATPGQLEKAPLVIPLGIGLVSKEGRDLPLHLEGVGALNTPMIELTASSQVFRFQGLTQRPLLSLNRGFTAPIILHSEASDDDLAQLIGCDSDSFNRWEAAQTMARRILVRAAKGAASPDVRNYALALQKALRDPYLDHAFKGLLLALPPESEIAATIGADVDSDLIHNAHQSVRREIAKLIKSELLNALVETAENAPYRPDAQGSAQRNLHYAALALLAAADPVMGTDMVRKELTGAKHMTAEVGALAAALPLPCAQELLEGFYARHEKDHLLVDKWFLMQAQIPEAGSFARVEQLQSHPQFRWSTPNRVFALLGGFAGNFVCFHAADGEGYRVVAEAVIRLHQLNPQVAAALAKAFRSWRLFDAPRRAQAERHMQRILAEPGLSGDVFEVVSKTFAP